MGVTGGKHASSTWMHARTHLHACMHARADARSRMLPPAPQAPHLLAPPHIVRSTCCVRQHTTTMELCPPYATSCSSGWQASSWDRNLRESCAQVGRGRAGGCGVGGMGWPGGCTHGTHGRCMEAVWLPPAHRPCVPTSWGSAAPGQCSSAWLQLCEGGGWAPPTLTAGGPSGAVRALLQTL